MSYLVSLFSLLNCCSLFLIVALKFLNKSDILNTKYSEELIVELLIKTICQATKCRETNQITVHKGRLREEEEEEEAEIKDI